MTTNNSQKNIVIQKSIISRYNTKKKMISDTEM